MLAVVSMALVSCGGGKKIKPTTTQFQWGELSKLVEVVDEPAEFMTKNKTNYLKVKLKVVDDEYLNEKIQDIGFTSLLSGLVISLEDEDGVEIGEAELADSDFRKLKELITKPEGTTDVILFKVDKGRKDGELFEFQELKIKDIAAFTPHMAADVSIR